MQENLECGLQEVNFFLCVLFHGWIVFTISTPDIQKTPNSPLLYDFNYFIDKMQGNSLDLA